MPRMQRMSVTSKVSVWPFCWVLLSVGSSARSIANGKVAVTNVVSKNVGFIVPPPQGDFTTVQFTRCLVQGCSPIGLITAKIDHFHEAFVFGGQQSPLQAKVLLCGSL